MAAALRHVTKITSLSAAEVRGVLALALRMKATPRAFGAMLERKTLLMLFEKPSLRTRVSLEAGMTSLGGHAIAYMTGDSPVGEKETYEDTGAVLSRMVDAVTARVGTRDQIAGLAANATVPIVTTPVSRKPRGFRTLEASISVGFQSIRLLLGPLIISARVLEIWTQTSFASTRTKSC